MTDQNFEGLVEVKNSDEVQFPAVGFALRQEVESAILIEKAGEILGEPPTHYFHDEHIKGYVFWNQELTNE